MLKLLSNTYLNQSFHWILCVLPKQESEHSYLWMNHLLRDYYIIFWPRTACVWCDMCWFLIPMLYSYCLVSVILLEILLILTRKHLIIDRDAGNSLHVRRWTPKQVAIICHVRLILNYLSIVFVYIYIHTIWTIRRLFRLYKPISCTYSGYLSLSSYL